MTEKEIRETAAERALEFAIVRAHPELTDGALQYLVAAGRETIEWAEAIQTGADFDVQGCVRSCRESDVGQLIFATPGRDDVATDPVAATADMTPAQRINWARANGLA